MNYNSIIPKITIFVNKENDYLPANAIQVPNGDGIFGGFSVFVGDLRNPDENIARVIGQRLPNTVQRRDGVRHAARLVAEPEQL
jgi:hypothetical protein